MILTVGAAIGTVHDRRDFLGNLAALVVWGGAQQRVLQTVVLREAQRASSRRTGIVIAALLFGAIHLPNPFLTFVTFGSGVLWCWCTIVNRTFCRWRCHRRSARSQFSTRLMLRSPAGFE